ncbi:DUF4255 domain-containing protein [Chitinimonas koreensis]|uniref:DUF4255 domain-containing protein n=1 Tax=Chitinimonas koreensis TaxID=356302 RepID=UPI00040CD57C|nr:DUF4255 domain-containing protein [Chitinimonas koreensis]QNM98662.1 DUF4255 domain-containing protein [Chitinimonas koreensis]
MSGFAGIAAVGKSIERMLNLAFTERQPVAGRNTRAVLVKTEDLMHRNVQTAIGPYALSIFLYRVDFNKAMRAAWSAVGSADGHGHLALDLHFLLSAWADNAEHEHLILGRAMQAIEYTPVLSGPLLYAPALAPALADEPQPGSAEAVQLLLEEISTEALMRTFDSLPTDYRLTVPYVARVVRIDTYEGRPTPPVTDASIPMRVTA